MLEAQFGGDPLEYVFAILIIIPWRCNTYISMIIQNIRIVKVCCVYLKMKFSLFSAEL